MSATSRLYRLPADQIEIMNRLEAHARECIQAARAHFAGRAGSAAREEYIDWCLNRWAKPDDGALLLLDKARAAGLDPTVNRYASAPSIDTHRLAVWCGAGILANANYAQTRSPVYRPVIAEAQR